MPDTPRKRGDLSHIPGAQGRKAKGFVYNPPGGPGWGGPAKGAGKLTAPKVTSEYQPTPEAKVRGKVLAAERSALLEDHLFNLATGAENETVQVNASRALHEIYNGKPVQTQVNVMAEDPRLLTDEQLMQIAAGALVEETQH